MAWLSLLWERPARLQMFIFFTTPVVSIIHRSQYVTILQKLLLKHITNIVAIPTNKSSYKVMTYHACSRVMHQPNKCIHIQIVECSYSATNDTNSIASANQSQRSSLESNNCLILDSSIIPVLIICSQFQRRQSLLVSQSGTWWGTPDRPVKKESIINESIHHHTNSIQI